MGSNFISEHSVRANINKSLTAISSKEVLGIPIFSYAANKIKSGFPSEWNVLNGTSENSIDGGKNNIATTMDPSETDNYSYISFDNSYPSALDTAWKVGQYTNGSSSWYYYSEGINATRLEPHQGIPFVTYHYKKEE
jgi:hypothetical protein